MVIAISCSIGKESQRGAYLNNALCGANYGPIPEGIVVHHKDEDKLKNAIENLELMPAGEHVRMHRREGWGYKIRDGIEYKPCRECKEVLPLTDFYKKPSGKDSDSRHCWCKPCYNRKVIERRGRTGMNAGDPGNWQFLEFSEISQE